MVTIKCTGDGLEFWLSGDASYTDLKAALMGRLSADQAFFAGTKNPVTIYGRSFTAPQKRELSTLLSNNFGLHKVRFADDEPTKYEAPPPAPAAAAEPAHVSSIFLCDTIRSGQRIESDGDITIVGDVNPGAELSAAGNICVFGRLSGVAHAGANGNDRACVVANRLAAPQVRIAGRVALIPQRDASPAEIVRLEGGRIVIAAI